MDDKKLVWTKVNIKMPIGELQEIEKWIKESGVKKYHIYAQAIRDYYNKNK